MIRSDIFGSNYDERFFCIEFDTLDAAKAFVIKLQRLRLSLGDPLTSVENSSDEAPRSAYLKDEDVLLVEQGVTRIAKNWHNELVARRGVLLVSSSKIRLMVASKEDVSIWLYAVQSIEVLSAHEVGVSTKDLRHIRLVFDRPAAWVTEFCKKVKHWMKDKVIPPQSTETSELATSQHTFDPTKEFERLAQAFPSKVSKSFRPKLVDQGAGYAICKSYPRRFVLPGCVTVAQMQALANYRSRGRIPVMRYVHPLSGAVLSRSSQPMTGILQVRSKVDEDVLEIYAQTSKSGKLTIVDARGRPAIVGNTLMGKGVERPGRYQNASLLLCQIGNIHTMRTSLLQTLEAVESENDEEFVTQLEQSKWLHFISLILRSSVQIAKLLDEEEVSVLVHCSDGFDRTPQLISLAKIMLCSAHRTIEGFCQLVSSEWCDFGHKFLDRSSDTESHEYSPVFLQFLDAVRNMLLQNPTIFEFKENLLMFLAEAVYSGQFDTFLYNSHKDRQHGQRCVWKHILDHADEFRQQTYTSNEASFYPSWSRKVVQLWQGYFLRDFIPSHELPESLR